MKIFKLNCTACGSPISIPEDLDFINCVSCGSFLAIERGEGYVALKVAEKLARAIENSGIGTQESIRENTQVTRSELQHLRMAQEVSTAQMQLSNIQAEIRGVERAPSSLKTIAQLKSLRCAEYQAMDKVRLLDLQYAAPKPEHLSACVEFIEHEIGWINSEINVLTQSDLPNRTQIIQTLNNRRSELFHKAQDLKVRALRSKFASFKVMEIPADDQAKLMALSSLLVEDEKNLIKLRGTPEGKIVYDEVIRRQQEVYQAWKKLEHKRLSGMLSTQASPIDFENQALLNENLLRIDQDLASLSGAYSNEVSRELQKKLLGKKQHIEKQIREIEKQAMKASQRAARASRPQKSGFEDVILVSITAFFAGIMALVMKVMGGFSSKSQSQANGQTLANESIISVASEQINSEAMQTALPGTRPGATGKPIDIKSIGAGCLLGLLIFGSISSIALVIIALTTSGNTSPKSGSGLDIFVLISAIGLILGGRVFFQRAAPGTCIRGFSVIPDITISKVSSISGLRNLWIVRSLVGIFTLGVMILVSMAILASIDGSNSGAIGAAGLAVIVLTLVLAVIVPTRTIIKG